MSATLTPTVAESDAERILAFNRTDKPFLDSATLHELIELQAARSGNSIAVMCDHDRSCGQSSLTWDELNRKANQLAWLLKADGVRPGEVIGLMTDRSFAMMIGILGILKAGAAYLPLSPSHPRERIRYMLEDCGARTLLVQSTEMAGASFRGRIVPLEDASIYQGRSDNLGPINGARDLAYVIYTSGSTGKPKGVMIEHRSVVNRLYWMQTAYPLSPNDVILQKTPYYFDVSVWELLWWALTGAKLSFLAPGSERVPLGILEAIRKHKITVMHFVPSMLNVFLDYLEIKPSKVRDSLGSLRRVFASGEALNPSHVRKFNTLIGQTIGTRLTNLYGPTEVTVDVSYFDCPTHNQFDRIPIGRPIDNTRFYILEGGQQAPIGEAGELCVAGVGLARGYMNNPTLTGEKFIDNPVHPGERIYKTGDIARWLPDGNVEYLGRADHQVKIRGFRIELGEIENAIRVCAGIRDCIVVARKYSESVVLLIAYVVTTDEFELEKVRRHLSEELPDYMLPNHFERIDQIPLTPNGKADKAALPAPAIQLRPA